MRVTSASSDSSFLTVSAAYNPAKPPPTITTRAAFLRTDVTWSSCEALQSMRVRHEHRPDGRDGDHEDQAHFFFFQAEDGIRDLTVTGVQTCALPISYVGRLHARVVGLRPPEHELAARCAARRRR